MAGGQALPSSNFSHTNPLLKHSRDLNCCQTLHFNATDLNPGSSTYFFLLFPFLGFTKSQVLHLRVGRSCDPLLRKAYSALKSKSVLLPQFNRLLEGVGGGQGCPQKGQPHVLQI